MRRASNALHVQYRSLVGCKHSRAQRSVLSASNLTHTRTTSTSDLRTFAAYHTVLSGPSSRPTPGSLQPSHNRMEDTQKLHGSSGPGSQRSEDWQTQAPYRIHGEQDEFDVKHEASCHCGQVQYQLKRAAPLDSKFCHCVECQVQHGGFLSVCLRLFCSMLSDDNARRTFSMGCDFPQGGYQFHARA